MSRPRRLTRTAGEVWKRPRRRYLRVVVLIAVLAAPRWFVVGGGGAVGSLPQPGQRDPRARRSAAARARPNDHGLRQRRDLIAELHGAVDRVIASSKLPVSLKEATVAVEDRRYYHEHGVDSRASHGRRWPTSPRAAAQGGSTITEQYVKNAYLGG